MEWRDWVLILIVALNVVNVWMAWTRTKLAKKKLERWEDR